MPCEPRAAHSAPQQERLSGTAPHSPVLSSPGEPAEGSVPGEKPSKSASKPQRWLEVRAGRAGWEGMAGGEWHSATSPQAQSSCSTLGPENPKPALQGLGLLGGREGTDPHCSIQSSDPSAHWDEATLCTAAPGQRCCSPSRTVEGSRGQPRRAQCRAAGDEQCTGSCDSAMSHPAPKDMRCSDKHHPGLTPPAQGSSPHPAQQHPHLGGSVGSQGGKTPMKEQGAPSPTSAGICYSPAHRSCFPIQTSPWSFSTTRSPQRAWMGGGKASVTPYGKRAPFHCGLTG